MPKALASATFQATYEGTISIELVAFKTTRNGQRVERFRWDGRDYPRFTSPFVSIEGAIRAVASDRRVSNIQKH